MRGVARRWRGLVAVLCALLLAPLALAAGTGCGAAADGRGATATAPNSAASPREGAPSLPLGELAGARIVAGFNGTAPPAALREGIRSGHFAGVVLYAENLPSRADARRLIAGLQSIPRPPAMRDPLLVLVDQEGGLVKRIDGAPFHSAEEIGQRGPAFARREGRRTARNLRGVGVGVNVDIAPVLDVPRPGSPIAETHRGYGTSPAAVAATGVAFAEGLQGGGVAATAKHFPGFGAAKDDSDVEVSRIGLSKARLRAVDEAPYRRYADAGGDLVMVAAATYPAFSSRPAAFSRALVSGELRHRLGYRGIVMTDALDTVSVAAFGDPAETGPAAARAGCDLLLFTEPGPAEAARRALVRQLRAGSLDARQFEDSARRVLDLRAELPG
ncbi:MAG TPA: glycoside hydrolase family 3 N-terminal domain-containing protein [Solirubrobacterales bacterium]|jgi:beta-N-acetylhexosaminidase|nr:glycoside hydrolase family 3 N-terminal domain-containing protein [Solirubrobacterales bacterium]